MTGQPCPVDHGSASSTPHDLVPIDTPQGPMWECPIEGQRFIEGKRT